MVGQNINDFKLFYDKNNISASAEFRAAFDPFTLWEVHTILGDLADTWPGRAIVVLSSTAGTSFSMWLLKILLLALGGCSTGNFSYAWIGFAGLVVIFATFALKRYRRR